MAQPPGWSLETSRSTGATYFYNDALKKSVWCDAALPAGWGFSRASPEAPKLYYHLASGETSHEPPAVAPPVAPPVAPVNELPAALLPAGAPQPSPVCMGFDVYLDNYRAREPWLARQLGHAAVPELAWWQAVRGGAPVATLPLPSRTNGGEGAGAAEAAEAVGDALVAAVLAVLGPAAVAGSWDPRRKRYVIRREAVPGFPAAAAGADGSEAASRKRGREEEQGGDRMSAPGVGGGVSLGGALAIAPRIRRAAEFPAVSGASLFTHPAYHASPTIAEIYTKGRTTTGSGVTKKLDSAVGPRESRHLYSVVRDNPFRRLLEVGMANGMSALSMCQALEDSGAGADGVLISLDPFQATQWDNTAVSTLARAGLSHRSVLVEEKSYLAMPDLLRRVEAGTEAPFDVVFVDGMHLFDYTLVDLFYADLLLRVGGVMLLDDMKHNGVAPAADWVKTNLPHFRYVPDTVCADTLGTFVKVGKDSRSWDHFQSFNGEKRR